jgi:hypothetical protein
MQIKWFRKLNGARLGAQRNHLICSGGCAFAFTPVAPLRAELAGALFERAQRESGHEVVR